jgi:hypothetical protein
MKCSIEKNESWMSLVDLVSLSFLFYRKKEEKERASEGGLEQVNEKMTSTYDAIKKKK